MNFEDERYVRVYVRDTVTWKLMGWQARCLLPLLLRKVDRAGCVDLDGAGAEGVAALVEIPLEVAEPGFKSLLARGVVEVRGDTLIFPKFMAAQEAKQSDKVRQQESRARKRDTVLRRDSVTERDSQSQTVTSGHESQQNVTAGHAESQDVTPYCTMLSRAQPGPEPSGSVAVGLTPPPHPVGLSGQSRPQQESQQGALSPEALASPKPAPERSRKPRKAPEPTRVALAWRAYCEAIKRRYPGEVPIWNAKMGGIFGKLVKDFGDDAAPMAAFYVGHNHRTYIEKKHVPEFLALNATTIHREWQAGEAMTATRARQTEETADNAWTRRLAQLDREVKRAPVPVECRVDDDTREEH